MIKNKNIIYILQFSVIIFFLAILLTSKVLVDKLLVAIFLIIYTVVVRKTINKSKSISLYKKEVLKYMITFAIIYLLLYYMIGIYTGYYKSIYFFSFKTLYKYIIPTIIIIITSEIIRSEFLSKNTKLSISNTIIFEVLIDLVLYVNIYNITTLDDFLSAIGFIMFSSIINNILFNYTSKKFGIIPNIAYRIITTTYIYIAPIIPNVYIYFKSIARMIYPLLVFIVFKSVYDKKKGVVTKTNKYLSTIITTIFSIFVIVCSLLISCKFKYGMLVIGSGSMTGTINKGDAIIYRRSKNISEIKEKDVIVFENNKRMIVHRVIKIEDINNEIRIYTKGDNNVQQDPLYSTKENIIGKVTMRIPSIGFPTIIVNEAFKKIKV